MLQYQQQTPHLLWGFSWRAGNWQLWRLWTRNQLMIRNWRRANLRNVITAIFTWLRLVLKQNFIPLGVEAVLLLQICISYRWSPTWFTIFLLQSHRKVSLLKGLQLLKVFQLVTCQSAICKFLKKHSKVEM